MATFQVIKDQSWYPRFYMNQFQERYRQVHLIGLVIVKCGSYDDVCMFSNTRKKHLLNFTFSFTDTCLWRHFLRARGKCGLSSFKLRSHRLDKEPLEDVQNERACFDFYSRSHWMTEDRFLPWMNEPRPYMAAVAKPFSRVPPTGSAIFLNRVNEPVQIGSSMSQWTWTRIYCSTLACLSFNAIKRFFNQILCVIIWNFLPLQWTIGTWVICKLSFSFTP